MIKWYIVPFNHRVFRSPIIFLPDVSGKKKKASIPRYLDTEAQKLLRPVLESAAQGLSRAVLSFMIQVHSNLKKHYYFDGPSYSQYVVPVVLVRKIYSTVFYVLYQATIVKFREKNSPVSCMQPAGGHHCAKNLW